jgi:DNA-binding CsgD family transcriptional regulator
MQSEGMHGTQGHPYAGQELTKRQAEVLERLELGYPVKQIATDIGVSRNAVYQTIERLRRAGAVPDAYTPSGQAPRRELPVGAASPASGPTLAPRESRLTALRDLGDADDSNPAYLELIEAAIAAGDAPALAYVVGRADGGGDDDVTAGLAEAALRRLGVIGADKPDENL